MLYYQVFSRDFINIFLQHTEGNQGFSVVTVQAR